MLAGLAGAAAESSDDDEDDDDDEMGEDSDSDEDGERRNMTAHCLRGMQATCSAQGVPAMETASFDCTANLIWGHECRQRCRATCAPMQSIEVIGRGYVTSDTGQRRQHKQQP